MQQWQRKRDPADVPTPVAVAVSDYCRRARASASPAQVREALSSLEDGDDFRARELCDGEPEASPLGPWAVVDIVRGTEPSVASEREKTGYYELVRSQLKSESTSGAKRTKAESPAAVAPLAEVLVAAPSAPRVVYVPSPAAFAAAAEQVKQKGKKATPLSMAQKIAPKKRTPVAAAEPLPVSHLPQEPVVERVSLTSRPKRSLPLPRGRFTRVEGVKPRLDELHGTDGKAVLTELVEQSPNRLALRTALERGWTGKRGDISQAELDSLLSRHGLLERQRALERGSILSAVTEHRGALSRAAWQLGIEGSDFNKLIAQTKLKREVDELRERFVREALSGKNLSQRLDLIARGRYLEDLAIGKKFLETLEKDLLELLVEDAPGFETIESLAAHTAKKHGLNEELLLRAIEKLGLVRQLFDQMQS